MKTKILRGIFALAVMVAAGYGVNRSMQKDTDFSEMALKNVEALAGEIDVFLPYMKTCSFCWCYYQSPVSFFPAGSALQQTRHI